MWRKKYEMKKMNESPKMFSKIVWKIRFYFFFLWKRIETPKMIEFWWKSKIFVQILLCCNLKLKLRWRFAGLGCVRDKGVFLQIAWEGALWMGSQIWLRQLFQWRIFFQGRIFSFLVQLLGRLWSGVVGWVLASVSKHTRFYWNFTNFLRSWVLSR